MRGSESEGPLIVPTVAEGRERRPGAVASREVDSGACVDASRSSARQRRAGGALRRRGPRREPGRAVQPGAPAARPRRRRAGRPAARDRPLPLGPHPLLGQGREDRQPADQRPRRDVATTPAFRASFQKRRCIVPADGFYEWERMTPEIRQPNLIRRARRRADGVRRPLVDLARPDPARIAELVRTFSIITTSANATLEPIHDRMPVILPASAWDAWLGPDAGRAGRAAGPAAAGPRRPAGALPRLEAGEQRAQRGTRPGGAAGADRTRSRTRLVAT